MHVPHGVSVSPGKFGSESFEVMEAIGGDGTREYNLLAKGSDASDARKMLCEVTTSVVDLDPVSHDEYKGRHQFVITKNTRAMVCTGAVGPLANQTLKFVRLTDADGKANGLKFNFDVVIVHGPQSKCKQDKFLTRTVSSVDVILTAQLLGSRFGVRSRRRMPCLWLVRI